MRATWGRLVATVGSFSAIGTDSCFSCGNTSRNQPRDPVSAKITPRMLTELLVTNPANTNVKPNARTIGHAVGAGISIERGDCPVRACISIASEAILMSFLYRPITYTTEKTTIH